MELINIYLRFMKRFFHKFTLWIYEKNSLVVHFGIWIWEALLFILRGRCLERIGVELTTSEVGYFGKSFSLGPESGFSLSLCEDIWFGMEDYGATARAEVRQLPFLLVSEAGSLLFMLLQTSWPMRFRASPVPASHLRRGVLGLQVHATTSSCFPWAPGVKLRWPILCG